MEIRKAVSEDIPKILDNRMFFVSGFCKCELSNDFRENTLKYLKENIGRDDFLAWLAFDNDEIKSIVVMSIYKVLPTVTNISGKHGLILNVWTHEDYRRQGLAYMLLKNIISQAKAKGVDRVSLKATDMGRLVYEKLGFKDLSGEMELKI
ncbi:MAG TPA: GNAT family N-acetyltransferase [Oscillospiraceae bacterium]|nr:GNAT family N-acetyltransferase [Oscillospiraceae bacterium]